jgi:hypothetical protein
MKQTALTLACRWPEPDHFPTGPPSAGAFCGAEKGFAAPDGLQRETPARRGLPELEPNRLTRQHTVLDIPDETAVSRYEAATEVSQITLDKPAGS